MMKKITLFLCALLSGLWVSAQECLPAWAIYQTNDYLYACIAKVNRENLSEASFKNELENQARLALAQQFEVNISNEAVLNKSAVNGHSQTSYTSLSQFSTNVTLKLASVKSSYSASSREGFAIAYIYKPQAREYYETEFSLSKGRVETALNNAKQLASNGDKIRARDYELKPALPEFDKMGDALAWLALFDSPRDKVLALMKQCQDLQLKVKPFLSDLEHATALYFECNTPMFSGQPFPMADKLAGTVSKDGVNFLNSSRGADFIFSVSATPKVTKANQHSSSSGGTTFTYAVCVEATVSVYKTGTKQEVYKQVVSGEGVASRDKNLAAEKAYQKLVESIAPIIQEQIH